MILVLLHKQCGGPLEPSDRIQHGAIFDDNNQLVILGYWCAVCNQNVNEEHQMLVDDIERIVECQQKPA